jgi:uncharacterized protein YjbJ (UPF0337 family)
LDQRAFLLEREYAHIPECSRPTKEAEMRKMAIAVVAASFVIAAPLGVTHAQSTTTTIKNEATVAWAKIQGAWTQSKGAVKEQWGKLTDDDVQEIAGRREVLVGKLQTRYGMSHEEAERQVGGFESKYR